MFQRISILLLLFFAACFDYSESIYFSPDLSGFIEIEYRVPLRAKQDTSLISYFDLEKSDINKRYTRLLSRKTEIENFQKEIEQTDSGRFAKVKYRIAFRAPVELERLLIGSTRVYFFEGKWVVQRRIPSSPPLHADAGRVSRRVHELSRMSLSGHNLNFLIFYPPEYDLFTNHGTIVRPGVESLSIPLSTTQNGGGLVWTMEIKANPLQPVSRGKP